MGKGNYASNIRKLEKSYKSGLTKPNMEGVESLCLHLLLSQSFRGGGAADADCFSEKGSAAGTS